ncbi:MAG: hypothetical protein EAY75_04135, partial [Bacteroidetes bacterium]
MHAQLFDSRPKSQAPTASAGPKATLVLFGALLYQALFFQEKMALNFSVYSAFCLVALWWFYVRPLGNRNFWWAAFCHVIALAAVLVHNTLLAKIAAVLTLLLCGVQAAFPHRNLYYAARTAVAKGFAAMPLWVVAIFETRSKFPGTVRQFFRLRIYAIPLMLALLFFGMYALANRVFGHAAQ